MKKRCHAYSLLIFLLLLVSAPPFARATEDESAVDQAKQGDLLGAVATYKASHDPAGKRGLVALQQLALEVLRLGLRLGDPHERNVVAGILGRRGDSAGIVVLDEALQSGKPMLRRTAADVLGDMATPDAVGLLRRLYHTDSEGRRLALSGLRRTRDRTAHLLYLDAVSSADTRLRTQGAGGLGELRSAVASPVLHALLKTEKDPIVAVTLAWSLAATGDANGLAYLTAKLSDASEQIRDAAAGLLGSLDDPSIVGLLRTVLQSDSSEMVRTTAAASLTHFKDASGLPLVQQALEHMDFRIRLAAAVSFSRMDYETAKPLIMKALQYRDPLTRSNVYQVIGQNRDGSVVSEVIEAVGRERDLYAKVQGLWTIGRIGGAESVPPLLDMLAEEEETVRHASAEALVFISERLLQQGGRPPR
ncbi:MAG: HEAT repeat domain-containing protein [Desulfurellaceae bacterium]|nr:HEAT repeat domain-containing protein [Desulfurellaceae bacterium]